MRRNAWVHVLYLGFLALFLAGCHLHGSGGSSAPTTLMSIAVTPGNPSLAKGVQMSLAAVGTFSDGSSHDISSQVAWSSATDSVATVGNSGKVAGVGAGASVIAASLDGVTGSTTLTVTSASLQFITVSASSLRLAAGVKQQLIAVGTFSDGTSQDISSGANWGTSASRVVSISSTGQALAMSAGSAVITAQLNGITGRVPLFVTAATVQSISVSSSRPTVIDGLTDQLSATASYSDGSSVDITSDATWSSGSVVARVNQSGLVTGQSVGVATVTASFGGVAASTALTVTAPILEAITVSPTTSHIANGLGTPFVATGTYSNGASVNISNAVNWTSGATGIATVMPGGQATAHAVGSAQITATVGAVSGSATLTVTPAVLEAITVSPASASLVQGLTQQLTATGIYSDGTSQPVSGLTWASVSTQVATVSASGLVAAVGPGTARVTASTGSISGGATFTVKALVLETIVVTPATPSIAKGLTTQLTATGIYSDGTSQPVSGLSWTSAANAVAKVSATGLVTTVSPGTVQVTATAGLISGSTLLTVTPAVLESISVTPGNPIVANGLSQQLEAVGDYSDGSAQQVNGVSWTSGATSVATVNADGLAAAVTPGKALMTATAGGVSGSTTLTITPAVLESMALTPANPSLAKGVSQQLTATGQYSDGSSQTVSDLIWSSAKTSVATVSANGLVTAIRAGTAVVTATAGAISVSTTLTVTPAVLQGISVSPSNPSIASGLTQQLTVSGLYSDGSSQPLTGAVWSSGATSVATVSASGLATALAPGAALITARAAGFSGGTTLTVTPALLQSISVTPANAELGIGFTAQMTATGNYSDGSSQPLNSVSWSSGTPSVASIAASGLVTATALGSTRVTATTGGISGSASLTVSNAQTGSGTLVAPGDNKHDYTFVTINASAYTSGGTINIVINLGNGVSAASYDLYNEDFTPVTSGRPVSSLANAYDVAPGTTTRLTYPFNSGSNNVFKLGLEGNWYSPAGSTNTFTYSITISPP